MIYSNTIAILEAAAKMADAIQHHRSVRGFDVVGKNGKSTYSLDVLDADLRLDAAERVYRETVGEAFARAPAPPVERLMDRLRRGDTSAIYGHTDAD